MCYLTCWVWLLSLSVMFSRFVHAIHPWISTPFLLALNSFLTACIFYCWVTNLCLTLCEPMGYSMPGSSVLHYLLDFAQIESVMLSNHLILSHSFLFLPSIFPSMGVFSNKSALHIRWPKYWSFNFSLNLSNEYSGLTSFRIDWLDLLAVQGTLKSLLQCHSWEVSVFWCSAFFMVHLSHPYMATEKP